MAKKSLVSAGIVAAVASSLCCIVPLVAAVASFSGAASAVSWIEPLRPYLLAITVLVIGLAWYLQLRPAPAAQDYCGCSTEKPTFIRSTKFLVMVTVFAVLMMAFPYLETVLFPSKSDTGLVIQDAHLSAIQLEIQGMTCTACENHVKGALIELPGVSRAEASYEEGWATVTYDRSMIDADALRMGVIDNTAYDVVSMKEIDPQP